MTRAIGRVVLAFAAIAMIGIPCGAQEVEPPFTWAGKGRGTVMGEGGTEAIEFQFELSVDAQGKVAGGTSGENATAKIKHLFYTEKKSHEAVPSFLARNLVIVFMINEEGADPLLAVVNGRILLDRFLYGEVLLARYEQGSETANALGVGNPEATLMEGDDLPNALKSVLKKCLPIGILMIEGDYRKP